MKKQYKNFTIEKTSGQWWVVRQDNNLIGRTPTEEEARRVVFLNDGEEKYITDEMMEII